MSIRPVDLQISVPRTAEVGKMNHTQNHNIETQQQNISKQFERAVERSTVQVTDTNKSEQNNINADGHNKNEHSNQKRKRSFKKDEDSDEKKGLAESKGMFDIRI